VRLDRSGLGGLKVWLELPAFPQPNAG
jgi:hypothetical protein